MSLQDILMERAALHFQNELGPTSGGTPSDLFAFIAETIKEERAKKLAEEERKTNLKNSFEQINQLQNANKDRLETNISYNMDKTGTLIPSVNISQKKVPTSAELLKEKREQRLADQYALNNATKLRQEFINRNEVKDYVTVSTNVRAMEGLLEKALTDKSKDNYVAVDQGLITMYNKLTDPQSVVRESEYARTPENLPVVNRITGAIDKLKKGGAGLTNDDRKALVEGAKIILKERGAQYNTALNEYTDLATQYALDPSLVTRGMKPHEEMRTFNTPEEADASGLPKGTVVMVGGRRYEI